MITRRRAAQNRLSSTQAAHELPTSAAQTVYLIPEIRQKILQCLAPPDLAIFMRVEKGCLRDCARELYHTMDLLVWLERFDREPYSPRHSEYCSAISVLQYDGDGIPAQRYPYLHSYQNPDYIVRFLSINRPEVMGHLLSIIQKHCDRLREVKLVLDNPERRPERFGKARWVVEVCAPTSLTSPANQSHINFYNEISYTISDPPPQHITPPLPPLGDYIVRHRFDLHIQSNGFRIIPPPLPNEWMASLKSAPHFANVYKEVSFGGLPVTLELLSSLYRRQIDAGHDERLAHISARQVAPWSILDFRSFAQLASGSLTRLDLADRPRSDISTSFADLSEIVGIVRTSLPNLRVFLFALCGIDTAEAVCRDILRQLDVNESGSVETLHIVADESETELYNVLRVCSHMCCPERCYVYIGPDRNRFGAGRVWSRKVQSGFLEYVRAQPTQRAKHLATVDFSTLSITHPEQIAELHYHEDGRPMTLHQSRARSWAERAEAAERSTLLNLPDMGAVMAEYKEAAERVQQMTLLEEGGHELLAAVRKLSHARDAVKRAKEVVASVDVEDDGQIGRYLGMLEGSQAAYN